MKIGKKAVTMTNIAFRVDGGSKIGSGHIMRCLALADAFPKDMQITFIIKEGREFIKLLENRGHEVKNIKNNLGINKELKEVKDTIKEKNIDILITDSYYIDKKYLLEIKKYIEVLVTISHYPLFPYPSDIVINGNIYAPDLNYSSLNGNTEFLLGTKYTLLRSEFWNIPQRTVNKKVSNILVSVGGSDPLNLTPKILKSLAISNEKYRIDVVIGPGFKNISKIIKEVKKSSIEILLHFNIKKISQLMLNSDLAISAGGNTLYELATIGTPAIVMLQAENQVLVAKSMENEGTIINLGFGNKISYKKLSDTINDLTKDFEKRKMMALKGQKITNGLGTKHCVDKILNSY